MVVVKGTVSLGFCRQSWSEAGGTDKVECQSSMSNEAVPEMQEGDRFTTTEAGYEVILAGLDGVFGGVGLMQVRRNELEIDARIAQKLF